MSRSRNEKAPAAATAEAQMSNQTNKEGIDLMNNTTAAITVPFHGANLALVEYNGQPYTPMKPIVEGMGVDWRGQQAKMQANATRWATMEISSIVAADGKLRNMLCMPLRKLPGWLMSISPNRVKDKAVRERVIQYQDECDDVLWDYWTQGEAINPRLKTKTALPNGLSLEQQDAIKAVVRTKVEALPKDKQKGAAIKCWSALKSKFGCGYKEIEPEFYIEALSLVSRLELEGELLPKETLPAAPVHIQLDYPMSDWIKRCLHPSVTPVESSPGRFRILPAHIGSGDGWSPTSYLIAELTRHGYETAAIRLEHLAMRHYMEWMGTSLWQIRLLAQNCRDTDAMQRALSAIECRANTRNLPPLVLPA